MQTKHARLLFILSVFLLSLVVVDFVRIGDKAVQLNTPVKPKVNLTEKVNEIGTVLSASDSAKPIPAITVKIDEPTNNFESKEPNVTLKGTVSDPTASVSAKLNNKNLGKLKVATDGAFQKEINLEEGLNKLVVSALGINLATASASISGTLLKNVLFNAPPLYLLLVLLALVAAFGVIKAFKHLKKNKDTKAKVDNPNNNQLPPAQTPPIQ